MGLVQLCLKVTYVIISQLRLQCRCPSINCWVKVIEWSFANVKVIVIKYCQFDFSRIEDEYKIQYLNPFTLRASKTGLTMLEIFNLQTFFWKTFDREMVIRCHTPTLLQIIGKLGR